MHAVNAPAKRHALGRIASRLAAGSALGLLSLAFLPSGAIAQTCQVTNTADAGAGSLRACVATANGSATVNAVQSILAAASNIDAVSGQIDVTSTLILDGTNPFSVTSGPAPVINLFTLSGGSEFTIGPNVTLLNFGFAAGVRILDSGNTLNVQGTIAGDGVAIYVDDGGNTVNLTGRIQLDGSQGNTAIRGFGTANRFDISGEIIATFGTDGLETSGDDTVIDVSGTITASGSGGRGIFASGTNQRIDISGDIQTNDSSSRGVIMQATQPVGGSSLTLSGSIVTKGASSEALLVSQSHNTVAILEGASIVAEGDFSVGLYSFMIDSTIDLAGAVSALGFVSVGVGLQGTDTTLNIRRSGTVSTQGLQGYGVQFSGAHRINVEGTVETQGSNAHAISGSGDGSVITVLATGRVSTTGNAHGIDLQSWGTGNTVIVAGTVSATGGGRAISFTGNGNVLELHPGATIIGAVQGGVGADTLRLAGAGAANLDQTQFSNFETVEKTGSSTWTLDGTGFGMAQIAVSQGTLLLGGGNTGFVTVNGGVFGGNGGALAVTVNNGGTVSPGLTPGETALLGASTGLTFNAGSTYAVDTSPTGADKIATAMFFAPVLAGGAVKVNLSGGIPTGPQSILLSAGAPLADTFASVSDNSLFFDSVLTYGSNDVFLTVTAVTGRIPGLNDNQAAVAGAIQAAIAGGTTLPGALFTIDANGLSQVSGEAATAAMGGAFDAAGQFVNLISGPGAGGSAAGGAPLGYVSEGAMLGYGVNQARAVETERRGRALSSNAALAALAGEDEDAATKAATSLALSGAHSADDIVEQAFASRWMLWGAAYGGGERVGGNGTVGSNTLSATTWGVASGVTRSFDGGSIGFALGGAGTSFSLANGLGGGNATSFNAGIHGSVDLSSAAYLSGALAWGYHATRTTRNVPGDTLTGRFGAQTLSGRIEAGYRLDLGGVSLTPYGAAEATLYSLPAYTETSAAGGPFALAFGRQSQTNIRTELGARSSIDLGAGVTLTGRAAWVWNARSGGTVTAAFQSLPGSTFTVNGARPAAHAALIDLGIQAALTDSVTARLTFTGEFSQNVTSYGATAKIGVKW